MNAPLLTIEDLACRRGGRVLFTGINLTLLPGESAHLTGPNGIGKSSLLRIVAGLLHPFAGSVQVHPRLALNDEALALDTERTLADALRFWAQLDGSSEQRLMSALADLRIAQLADVPVRMLSTGQRKRAALARTLAGGTTLWLLDEPSNGLDTASCERLGELVDQHRAAGGAVLVASHQSLSWAQDRALTLTAPEDGPEEDAE